jgi:Family of unknown function (DUF7009)
LKLRLLDDSIRLRLSRGDVAQAEGNGVVEGRTRFPDGSAFTFALESEPRGAASASYAHDRMVVRLPAGDISRWANDDHAVSLEQEIELPGGERLKLLVEKDFQCLTARADEDQSDLFVNPGADEC